MSDFIEFEPTPKPVLKPLSKKKSGDDNPAGTSITIHAVDSSHSVNEISQRPGSDEHHIPPFSANFTDNKIRVARKIYIKILGIGVTAVSVTLLAVFAIYWGALWHTPAHSIQGWIVDFDQSSIGSAVTQALKAHTPPSTVAWSTVPAAVYPGGVDEVAQAVLKEKTWVAVVINPNVTNILNSAALSADSSYNGTSAVTVYAQEARNENAFRTMIRPAVQAVLEQAAQQYAEQHARQLASPALDLQRLLNNSPQVVTRPIDYTIDNLRPFNVPVATAITFVGLIYLLVLCFFIVMIGVSAREVSGLETHLTTASLIRVRLTSTFTAYFFISLFYSLLSRAFQVDFGRRFGNAGFVVFWMLNLVGMLSVGLGLEAMLTLLTAKAISFFMILWIISNVSVCIFPIDALPRIYHYGYAMPFYNISRAVRVILFDTRDMVGLNFGILFAWVAISCITLPHFQWYMRRKRISEMNHTIEPDPRVVDEPDYHYNISGPRAY